MFAFRISLARHIKFRNGASVLWGGGELNLHLTKKLSLTYLELKCIVLDPVFVKVREQLFEN